MGGGTGGKDGPSIRGSGVSRDGAGGGGDRVRPSVPAAGRPAVRRPARRGDSDPQGRQTKATATPLERRAGLAARGFLTEEERAAGDAAGDVAREQRGSPPGTGKTGSYSRLWGRAEARMAQTSLIVDPPERQTVAADVSEAQRRSGREG